MFARLIHELTFVSLGPARRPRVGPDLSQLDAGPGNRRSVAVATRAIAYVITRPAWKSR